MKMVKHENVVKLYEVLASRTKVRRGGGGARRHAGRRAGGRTSERGRLGAAAAAL